MCSRQSVWKVSREKVQATSLKNSKTDLVELCDAYEKDKQKFASIRDFVVTFSNDDNDLYEWICTNYISEQGNKRKSCVNTSLEPILPDSGHVRNLSPLRVFKELSNFRNESQLVILVKKMLDNSLVCFLPSITNSQQCDFDHFTFAEIESLLKNLSNNLSDYLVSNKFTFLPIVKKSTAKMTVNQLFELATSPLGSFEALIKLFSSTLEPRVINLLEMYLNGTFTFTVCRVTDRQNCR
jgi:hypothetical protein